MKKNYLIILTLGFIFLSIDVNALASGDSLKYANWQNKDPKLDKTWGISTDLAYAELIKEKESKTVIVAVIDNGVDINHEDLKDNIWVNEDEIPGNGIDDDNNGFIDDIHGWNFLGNAEGKNIDEAPFEVTRLYREFKLKVDSIPDDSLKKLPGFDYKLYKKVKSSYTKKITETEQQKAYFEGITEHYSRFDSILSLQFGKENYTINELKKLKVVKKSSADTAKRYMTWIKKLGVEKKDIVEYEEHFKNQLKYHYNPEFNSREIIGGDEYSLDYRSYGNNDVAGPNPDHGTMVSGIIAATRNNNIGINGVADNVKIMVLRAVPDGDEWDKDVANSISYAIENGAEIINMSFGKEFSPQKNFVDEAIKIADEKNVLLVHAAGNDSENNDRVFNYPRNYNNNDKKLINNWLTIGATAKEKRKKEFVASFSNYGKKSVDIFAPGHKILTCSPGNKYDIASGTSFSAPMVSGAAALIKSYYPTLTSAEIKEIILESSDIKDCNVVLPGTGGKNKEIVKFSNLSSTGGLLNVYKALQLAETKSATK